MMLTCFLALSAVLISFVPADAHPQADSAPARFEVASIKYSTHPPGIEGGNRSRVQHTPTSLSMWNVSLSDCVQWAYDAAPFQISGAPLSAETYDILAKTETPVPVSQLRLMLQNILATRFKLALHRETRMLPVYEMVVAKGGPKLQAAVGDTSMHAAESLPRVRNDSFVFSDVSMPEFARMLAQLRGIDLPVVDRTGLSGAFDIVLKSAPAAAREADTAALFSIIQEQLGLKLAHARAPFEVLVIHRAGKPGEN